MKHLRALAYRWTVTLFPCRLCFDQSEAPVHYAAQTQIWGSNQVFPTQLSSEQHPQEVPAGMAKQHRHQPLLSVAEMDRSSVNSLGKSKSILNSNSIIVVMFALPCSNKLLC